MCGDGRCDGGEGEAIAAHTGYAVCGGSKAFERRAAVAEDFGVCRERLDSVDERRHSAPLQEVVARRPAARSCKRCNDAGALVLDFGVCRERHHRAQRGMHDTRLPQPRPRGAARHRRVGRQPQGCPLCRTARRVREGCAYEGVRQACVAHPLACALRWRPRDIGECGEGGAQRSGGGRPSEARKSRHSAHERVAAARQRHPLRCCAPRARHVPQQPAARRLERGRRRPLPHCPHSELYSPRVRHGSRCRCCRRRAVLLGRSCEVCEGGGGEGLDGGTGAVPAHSAHNNVYAVLRDACDDGAVGGVEGEVAQRQQACLLHGKRVFVRVYGAGDVPDAPRVPDLRPRPRLPRQRAEAQAAVRLDAGRAAPAPQGLHEERDAHALAHGNARRPVQRQARQGLCRGLQHGVPLGAAAVLPLADEVEQRIHTAVAQNLRAVPRHPVADLAQTPAPQHLGVPARAVAAATAVATPAHSHHVNQRSEQRALGCALCGLIPCKYDFWLLLLGCWLDCWLSLCGGTLFVGLLSAWSLLFACVAVSSGGVIVVITFTTSFIVATIFRNFFSVCVHHFSTPVIPLIFINVLVETLLFSIAITTVAAALPTNNTK